VGGRNLEPGTGVVRNVGVAGFFWVGVAPASVQSIFPVSILSTPVARAGTGTGVAFFTTAAGVAGGGVGVAGAGVVFATAVFFAGVAAGAGVAEATTVGVGVGFGVFGLGVVFGHSQFPVLPL
jgi:hypothetical protein